MPEESSSSYEMVLLVNPEVFIYRIPPLSGNATYKASDWNLGDPDRTGRLRLISIHDHDHLEIRLEDKTSSEFFARTPIAELDSVDFEPVNDSSRYFVIRLPNDRGLSQFVEIGFPDRGGSFDLNVAVQDHFTSMAKSEKHTPKLDFSFKEAQTTTVSIGKKTITFNASNKSQIPATGGLPDSLLRSSPSSANRVRKLTTISAGILLEVILIFFMLAPITAKHTQSHCLGEHPPPFHTYNQCPSSHYLHTAKEIEDFYFLKRPSINIENIEQQIDKLDAKLEENLDKLESTLDRLAKIIIGMFLCIATLLVGSFIGIVTIILRYPPPAQ